MGTSVNQRSPSTPNWDAALLAYETDVIPIERAVQEIWRAATNQPEGNLGVDLGTPIIAECLRIAEKAASREQAVQEARRAIAFSGQTSLAADIAQRAVTQTFAKPQDRTSAFAESLFAEAGNYLVSRDLPGHIGPEGRAKTISQAIGLKNAVQERIATVVSETPRSTDLSSSSALWRTFVDDVVTRLTGRS
jgi:hypothetical protein